MAPPASSAPRVKKHRAALGAQGLRPARVWVPRRRAVLMTAPRARREGSAPPSPPERAPPRRGGVLSSATAWAAGLAAAPAVPGTSGVPSPGAAAPSHPIAPFPSASSPHREGFARIIHHSDEAGEGRVYGIDGAQVESGPVGVPLAPRATAHFNSEDREAGNPDTGATGAIRNDDEAPPPPTGPPSVRSSHGPVASGSCATLGYHRTGGPRPSDGSLCGSGLDVSPVTVSSGSVRVGPPRIRSRASSTAGRTRGIPSPCPQERASRSASSMPLCRALPREPAAL